jgi:hypothetical protein
MAGHREQARSHVEQPITVEPSVLRYLKSEIQGPLAGEHKKARDR